MNYWRVFELIVFTGWFYWSAAIESVLLLTFLFTLVTRGTRRGRNRLVVISALILFFAVLSISAVLTRGPMPLPLPPEMWSEPYGDALLMYSLESAKAIVDSIFLFILSISYTCVRFRER